MDEHWTESVKGDWSDQVWTGRPEDAARPDSYLVWADATGFDDLGGKPTSWVRVMIELCDRSPDNTELTAQLFAESIETKHRDWEAWIRLSSLYRYPPPGLEHTRFLTAIVTRRFFAELQGVLKGFVKRFELGLPVVPDDVRVPAAPVGPAFGPQAESDEANGPARGDGEAPGGSPVIVGVIDDGLAFAHERFRESGGRGTRIERFWNQEDPPGTAPKPHYGREFAKRDIDDLMKRCRRGERVDEDAVYRMADYAGVRQRWAHGTQVMDLACGADVGEQGDAPRIICVQFRVPGRTIRDTSGLWFGVYALDALRYILHRAREFAHGRCPVVVNLSYGYIAGPHDGSSMIETAIDELILSNPDLCVVIPAGNSNLARCHALFSLASDESHSVSWRVLPDGATPSFLEIWLPTLGVPPDVELTVKTPWGSESPPICRNHVYTWRPGRHVLCTVVYLNRVANGNPSMILVALAPTTTRNPRRDAAAAGMWTISLTNRGHGALHVDAWIQRNETPYGYPLRGRQSRFEDPDYVRFDRYGRDKDYDEQNEKSWVRRQGTTNSVATGRYPVVIGGFLRSDGRAAPYSATGPIANSNIEGPPFRTGPDASAVSEESVVCYGVLGAGTRSGSVTAMTGTSVAGPQIARLLAQDGMGQGRGLSTAHGQPVREPMSARLWVAAKAAEVDGGPASAAPRLTHSGPMPTVSGQGPYKYRLPPERSGAGRIAVSPVTGVKRVDR